MITDEPWKERTKLECLPWQKKNCVKLPWVQIHTKNKDNEAVIFYGLLKNGSLCAYHKISP